MDRRGFLGAILAASMAPMVVKAGVLMPVRQIVVPSWVLHGDGITDDTEALQQMLNGGKVYDKAGRLIVGGFLAGHTYAVSRTLTEPSGARMSGGRIDGRALPPGGAALWIPAGAVCADVRNLEVSMAPVGVRDGALISKEQ